MLDLVTSFEASSGDFGARFHKCKLAEQQQFIEHAEQATAAELAALQEKLQNKRQHLVQQQSTIKDFKQRVADSRTILQGEHNKRQRMQAMRWHPQQHACLHIGGNPRNHGNVP